MQHRLADLHSPTAFRVINLIFNNVLIRVTPSLPITINYVISSLNHRATTD